MPMEIAEMPETRASRYRHTAAQLRRQAAAFDKTQERAELLTIADQYDRLADRLASPRTDKGGGGMTLPTATREIPRDRAE
jgi:hypothetical protein